MSNDKTIIYDVDDFRNYMITETLINVKNILDEKGYNGLNQIVGYLLNDDITYISNYKNAREKIQKVGRQEIIEVLLANYLKDVK